tara:strand:- start:469 stop:1014 length:546 start_codon:yes stop_codon:yes gene_type:complete
MNEDERIKKLIRSNLSGPGHSELFTKETHWRSKPKKSDYNYKEVVDKLKEQDPTQCEFFRSPWKYNESSIHIKDDKDYIKVLEGMVEEMRDQINYKDEEWYWYWIPERLKYKLLSEDQAREIEILKDENTQLKSKNIHYLKNIARWRKVARHLKEIILTLDYETNNTSHRKVRINKTVGDT